MLADYGELTRTQLRRYLPRGNPGPYLYDLLSVYPARGGKMMRSSLCIATARAFGARTEQALCSAVAIELLHNALLIHDDIEDGSDTRRGSPTLHQLHGIPLALNAGDTMSLLSLRPLKDNFEVIGPVLGARIFEETERMAWESAEGQAMELGWRKDNRVGLSDEDYLVMVLKKTCWLAVIHPCRAGAIIGTRDRIDLKPFVRFGFFVGAAFQIQDDVLNLIGEDDYGKERDGDLWEGKRTLILNHAYRQSDALAQARWIRILGVPREERSTADIYWMRRQIDRHGSIDYAHHVAHGLAGAALHEFDGIFGGLAASPDKSFIEEVVTWVLDRSS